MFILWQGKNEKKKNLLRFTFITFNIFVLNDKLKEAKKSLIHFV